MGKQLRIVLIDDEPDLRKLVERTLQFIAGWDVASAPDGESGIELVRSHQPNAAIVDLMMPGMDGFEVARRLKQDPSTAHIPVVLLTARTEIDQARLEASGADGVVFKPFEPEALAAQIAECCGEPDA